eukprot:3651460-Rhodomonas_salina.1
MQSAMVTLAMKIEGHSVHAAVSKGKGDVGSGNSKVHATVAEGKGEVESADAKEGASKEPEGVGSQPDEGGGEETVKKGADTPGTAVESATRDVEVGAVGAARAGPGDAAKAVKPTQPGREQVEVLVLGAKHLPKKDILGTCDPYLVLKYAGRDAKTSVQKGTFEPTWEERFLLNVIPNRELEVRCMDWDMFHKDDYVG